MVLLNSDTYYLEKNKIEIIKLKDTITEMKNLVEGIINYTQLKRK